MPFSFVKVDMLKKARRIRSVTDGYRITRQGKLIPYSHEDTKCV
jgi:hypothetical protein